jgi:cell division protein FtsW (lipid II flippase)
MLERRLYFHIDWALLLAILTLCGLGVAMIYSTTGDPTRGISRLHITQMYAIVLGLAAMWSRSL